MFQFLKSILGGSAARDEFGDVARLRKMRPVDEPADGRDASAPDFISRVRDRDFSGPASGLKVADDYATQLRREAQARGYRAYTGGYKALKDNTSRRGF